MLQSQDCGCGEYQAKYLQCSHVMAACKSVNVDPMNYLLPYSLYKTFCMSMTTSLV